MNNFTSAQEGLLLLRQTLEQIAPLPDPFYQRLAGMLKPDHLPKNKLLLRVNEIARRVYFVVSGLAKAVYTDAEGHERISWFNREGDVMISVHSFYTGAPSQESIVLCEDSLLYSITKRQLDTLYSEYPAFNEHGRVLTQLYYIKAEARAIMLRMPKIRDRYFTLWREERDLFRRVPLNQLACYLCTTAETLSRIRASEFIDLNQVQA